MELMIRHSEIITILIQAFMITVAGFIFVGCLDELMHDLKRANKLKKKGGLRTMRHYICPCCGFKAWTLDHIYETTCSSCGEKVVTEPVPKVKDEESFIRRGEKNRRQFAAK